MTTPHPHPVERYLRELAETRGPGVTATSFYPALKALFDASHKRARLCVESDGNRPWAYAMQPVPFPPTLAPHSEGIRNPRRHHP